MRRACAVVVLVLVASVGSVAQSADQEVQKANEALLAAAAKGDKAAYAKVAADDLRWVVSEGAVLSKAERIARLAPGTTDRVFRDVDVKVYGTTAVLICRSDWTDKGRKLSERVHRVFVNRNGQWQLVSHSATPMESSSK